MGKYFGTDGFRGEAGIDLTEMCIRDSLLPENREEEQYAEVTLNSEFEGKGAITWLKIT